MHIFTYVYICIYKIYHDINAYIYICVHMYWNMNTSPYKCIYLHMCTYSFTYQFIAYTCIYLHMCTYVFTYEYITMHMHIFTYVYICIYISIHHNIPAYIYTCVHMYLHICTYVLHMCTYVFTYVYICIYICVHMYLHMCTYVFTYVHICIYTCVHMYLFICTYVFKYVYIWSSHHDTHAITITSRWIATYRVAKTHRIPYLYDLYLVALLWKMICNLGDPMSLRHPVQVFTYEYIFFTYTCIYICHELIHTYVYICFTNSMIRYRHYSRGCVLQEKRNKHISKLCCARRLRGKTVCRFWKGVCIHI